MKKEGKEIKKIISLVLRFLLLLSGCGGRSEPNKSDEMNLTTYDNGLKVLAIMNKFLDDDMSLEDASDKILTLWDAMASSSPLDSCVKSISYTFA